MLRLCSENSRSYTPQGGTELSPGRSAWLTARNLREPPSADPHDRWCGGWGRKPPATRLACSDRQAHGSLRLVSIAHALATSGLFSKNSLRTSLLTVFSGHAKFIH